jgi:hypothetical protein
MVVTPLTEMAPGLDNAPRGLRVPLLRASTLASSPSPHFPGPQSCKRREHTVAEMNQEANATGGEGHPLLSFPVLSETLCGMSLSNRTLVLSDYPAYLDVTEMEATRPSRDCRYRH